MLRRFIGGMLCQSVAVVTVVVAASSLSACASDAAPETGEAEQTAGETKSFQDATIPLDPTSASSNGTAIVNDLTFDVPSSVLTENAAPAALADSLASNQKTSIGFSNVVGASGDFTMSNPTLSGKLKIASCTFTVAKPVPLVGTIFIKSCAIKVTATGVPTGGGGVQGTASLVLNGVSSDPVTIKVALTPTGALVVNGHPTQVVVTGTSGS